MKAKQVEPGNIKESWRSIIGLLQAKGNSKPRFIIRQLENWPFKRGYNRGRCHFHSDKTPPARKYTHKHKYLSQAYPPDKPNPSQAKNMPTTALDITSRAVPAAALAASLSHMIAAYPSLRRMLSPAVEALAKISATLDQILQELRSQNPSQRLRSFKVLLAAVVEIEEELEDIDVAVDEVVGKVLNEEVARGSYF